MLEQNDFSESGWTGPGMMEPMLPSMPFQPPAPSPAPRGEEEDGMSSVTPRRAPARKKKPTRKKAKTKTKAKKKTKKTKTKAKAKRAAGRSKPKRKPARGRRR